MSEPIENRLRKLIIEQNVTTDTYKMALGTIVELTERTREWERKSKEWCSRCPAGKSKQTDEANDSVVNDLPGIHKLRMASASSPYGYYNVTVEQANALSSEVRQAIGKLREELAQTRYHRDRLEAQIESAKTQQACESDGETDEEFEKRVCRDAFLDGANWLEHWFRDKPLSSVLTRRVHEEALRRWPVVEEVEHD